MINNVRGNSQAAVKSRRQRVFDVLDNDSNLTDSQLAERFGIHVGTANTIKKEWRQLRAL